MIIDHEITRLSREREREIESRDKTKMYSKQDIYQRTLSQAKKRNKNYPIYHYKKRTEQNYIKINKNKGKKNNPPPTTEKW